MRKELTLSEQLQQLSKWLMAQVCYYLRERGVITPSLSGSRSSLPWH